MSSTCTACGTTYDLSAMVYTKAGDLVCISCQTVERDADADERVADNRTRLIVGSASVLCALSAFAIFAYAYHDRHYVYVENGHALQTSDASFEVLKFGIVLALVAAGVGGALANRVVGRSRRKA